MHACTEVSALDLLLATNERMVDGILCDLDGDEEIDGMELLLRQMAHELYTAICET